jgi:hypothetical protein
MPALTALVAVRSAHAVWYGLRGQGCARPAFFTSAPDWLVVKAPSPLLGFNNNVRHKGRVFHIQTEDSGVRHPHVITHLFADGGRILKTTKTSYTEHLGQPSMADTVRAMMQEQHKSMFIALRDGQFDYLFEESGGSAATRAASKPGSLPATPAAPPPPVVATPQPIEAPPPPPAPIVVAPPVDSFASAATQEMPSSPPIVPPRAAPRPRLDLDPSAIHAREAAPQAITLDESALEPAIDLDLDALERAAAEAQTPFFQQIQDLPPPPAAVLGKRPAGSGYSVTPSYESSSFAPPPPPGPQVGRLAPPAPGRVPPPPIPAQPPKIDPASSGRYAPSRPAAIFATTRPPEGASIFGEDLISEKSLDEVILSYLAEDLEGPTDKK